MRILLPLVDSQKMGWINLVLLITLRKKTKIRQLLQPQMTTRRKALVIEVVMIQLAKRKTRLTLPITIYRHVFLVSEENDHPRSRKCKTVWDQATGKWTAVIVLLMRPLMMSTRTKRTKRTKNNQS